MEEEKEDDKIFRDITLTIYICTNKEDEPQILLPVNITRKSAA